MAMEEARRDLQHRLEEVLGKEHALTLMATLPPTEAATKADVGNLREDMRTQFETSREQMRAMEARLASKVALEDLRQEMRGMDGRLSERIDLKVEASENRVIAALERGLGDLRKDMIAQTRVFVFSTITAVVAVGGLAVTAARLG